MSTLADHIDRITLNTRSIKQIAAQTAADGIARPFPRALLNTQLGDLIRDVDNSELGLFTLTGHSSAGSYDKASRQVLEEQVKRVEFPCATPLKGVPSRKTGSSKCLDVEPEIFARAALKCIKRYQPIRRMPRAAQQVEDILASLESVRQSMLVLDKTLQASLSRTLSVKEQIDNEELRIKNLQVKMQELNKRKEQISSRASLPRKAGRLSLSKPQSPQKEKVWDTPLAGSRSFQYTQDLLMDEEVDLADTSSTSFTSHRQLFKGPSSNLWPSPSDKEDSNNESKSGIEDNEKPQNRNIFLNEDNWKTLQDVVTVGSHEDPYPTASSQSPSPPKTSLPSPEPSHLLFNKEPSASHTSASADDIQDEDDTPMNISISRETELIIVKIWSTIGDIIMPNHPYDVPQKYPSAKETVALLQNISSSPLTMESPSIVSHRVAPLNFQQIMTAYLMMLMISSPSYSLHLSNVKDLLLQKAIESGGANGQGSTRILYGCVAKRLLMVDRGKGEQIVKFNM